MGRTPLTNNIIKKFADLTFLILVLLCGCRRQDAPKQQASSQPASSQAPAQPTPVPSPAKTEEPKWDRKGDFMAEFGAEVLFPTHRDPHVSYALNASRESFFVHVPEDYSGAAAYGLVVFTDADDESRQLPN